MAEHEHEKHDPAIECALAYALWDAENSTKLERPEDFNAYVRKARSVLGWLRIHGAAVNVR